MLSWDGLDSNMGSYMVSYAFTSDDGEITGSFSFDANNVSVVDGVASVSIAREIRNGYFGCGFNGETVTLSLSLVAHDSHGSHPDSLQSELSNTISYSQKSLEQLLTPTGVALSEDCKLSWDTFDQRASYYMIEYSFAHGDKTTTGSFCIGPTDWSIVEGVATADISTQLESGYMACGLNGVATTVSASLTACHSYGEYMPSARSAYSNAVTYKRTYEVLPVPTDVTLANDCTLSWGSVDDRTGCYSVWYTLSYGQKTLSGSFTIDKDNVLLRDGVAYASISKQIADTYKYGDLDGEEEVSVSASRSIPQTPTIRRPLGRPATMTCFPWTETDASWA